MQMFTNEHFAISQQAANTEDSMNVPASSKLEPEEPQILRDKMYEVK
jgi:hypothetical protein